MYTLENKENPVTMCSPTVSSVLAQAKLTDPHPAHVCLLAGDLTGACDAAAAFLNASHFVRVWFGLKALRPTSKSVPCPEKAILAVSRAARLNGKSNSSCFKKIDSSARGSLAAQGHIPMKLLDFEATVNVSLGIPVIHTSVDRGTAFDIAGRNCVDSANMKTAMRLAARMAYGKLARDAGSNRKQPVGGIR
jgi:hypothetical protein